MDYLNLFEQANRALRDMFAQLMVEWAMPETKREELTVICHGFKSKEDGLW